MATMLKQIVFFLFVVLSHKLSCQVGVLGSIHQGVAILESKALIPINSVFSLKTGLIVPASSRFGMVFQYSRNSFLEKMEAIQELHSHSLEFGGYLSIADSSKWSIQFSGIYSRVSFSQDFSFYQNNIDQKHTSLWSQWGANIGISYYWKRRLGFNLDYSRYFSHQYDPRNFQSWISIGAVFKWNRVTSKD